MDQRLLNWGIFLLLCLTWGSSFILMKLGLLSFSPYQVASLRLISAGIVLLPFFFKFIRQTPGNKIPVIILSGLLGNGIPAYLFCIAETRIDSSLAGMLNSFTPVFALLFSLLLFRAPVQRRQLTGLAIGFIGVICLFLAKGVDTNQYWYYGLFIVGATACYGLNIALVHHYLKGYSTLQLVSISLFFMALFSAPVLIFSDFTQAIARSDNAWVSLGASMVLGVMGTGVASLLFYQLIRSAGAMFASMVTYGLPVVAIGWGLLAGEHVNGWQVLCLAGIMGGVYLVSRK
ncbi:EamA family transporter [Chitinophaga alhagiae]|uniref:EamA family transporter n=1 Tax=Chitinophaga alhagiae TaxID=2203219 RepID=A0ABN5LUE4_9BACT|nr:DMT family transporter [Chitinophaga alhagiae]AWO01793.1 EamA family transporter [Chitinophaga alhagiae]